MFESKILIIPPPHVLYYSFTPHSINYHTIQYYGVRDTMRNHKQISIILLVLLTTILLPVCIAGTSADLSHNTTLEMNGVKFDVPLSNNNTTNEYKEQGTTWAYEDYEHGISVYVCTQRPTEYSPNEQFNSATGTYEQLTPLGDKWVVVCAESADEKDFVWKSLRLVE